MPSRSLLCALCSIAAPWFVHFVRGQGPYVLVDDYSPARFFDGFRFYTGNDPTNGFVQYVNQSYAAENRLIKSFSDRVTVGVDTTNVYNATTGPGRPSVRLETLQTYTHGLFILSLNHMPYGCGTWPAFWSLGPDWPNYGEADIIEGVNQNTDNIMVLHTSSNCTVAGDDETGTLLTNNCDSSGNDNSGCGVLDGSSASYGRGFNAAGGGVYAMEWTSSYIRMWYFPHNRVPESIQHGRPDTTKFGTPAANFQGSCDIDSHFANHYLVFDITFCGDYAGNVYGESSCPNSANGYAGCKTFVAENPSDFTDAYWSINYLRVYSQQPGSSVSSSSSSSLSSVTPVAATSSGILSSLEPPPLGSSSHIGSSTLSIPKSKHSKSSHESSTGPSSSTVSKILTHSTSSKHSETSMASSHSSKSSHVVSSSKSAGMSLPTTTGTPECHSIFQRTDGAQYRIYCNYTIKGPVFERTTAFTFARCIRKCDHSGNMCAGCVFTNSTDPPVCILKSISHNFEPRESDIVAPAQHVVAALRYVGGSSLSSSTSSKSRKISSSNHLKSSKTLSSDGRESHKTGSLSISIRTLGTVTKTVGSGSHATHGQGSGERRTGIRPSGSVSLCFTCGLVPTVVSSGYQPPGSPGTPIGTNPGDLARTTNPPRTIPGGCNVARTIIVTKVVQTTVTKCPVPLTCPAQPTGLPSPGHRGSGLSGHLICSPEIAPGTIYTDAAGMLYQIYCGQTIEGPDLSEPMQKSFAGCMAACDSFNYVHFNRNGCLGVSFDRSTGRCRLKSRGSPKISLEGTDSAVLLTNVAGGGGGNHGSSGSGGTGSSGIGSESSGGHGKSRGGGGGGPSPLSHTGHLVSTIISHDRTSFTTHGTNSLSGKGPSPSGRTSYLVSTHVSNGHTILSTYGTPTLPATTAIHTSYLVSTRVSNGHTIVTTYGTTTERASTVTKPTVITHLSTTVSNGHTSVKTIVSTASNGKGGTIPGKSVITVTQGGHVYTITGHLVTITEPGSVKTVTRNGVVTTITQHDVSYEVSYVFATQTITTGGGGSSSSSSSQTCRTAATHYAQSNQKRKRSVLDFKPRDVLGVERPFKPVPAARPLVYF